MRGGFDVVYPNSLDAAVSMISAWKSSGYFVRNRFTKSNPRGNCASAFATTTREVDDDEESHDAKLNVGDSKRLAIPSLSTLSVSSRIPEYLLG